MSAVWMGFVVLSLLFTAWALFVVHVRGDTEWRWIALLSLVVTIVLTWNVVLSPLGRPLPVRYYDIAEKVKVLGWASPGDGYIYLYLQYGGQVPTSVRIPWSEKTERRLAQGVGMMPGDRKRSNYMIVRLTGRDEGGKRSWEFTDPQRIGRLKSIPKPSRGSAP